MKVTPAESDKSVLIGKITILEEFEEFMDVKYRKVESEARTPYVF